MLVNSVGKKDKDLKQCGEVAKAFLSAVGPQLQEDFEKIDGLSPCKVYACKLSQKQLPCKALLHIGLDSWGKMTKEVRSSH